MSIHILYRISDKSNPKKRIENATKRKCLANACAVFGKENITVFADNCESATIELIGELGLEAIEISLGNSGSWLYTVNYALEHFDDEQIVYLLEDDYLHLETAAQCLNEGVAIADYVSLYDHPDKYLAASAGGNPFVKKGGESARVLYSGKTHWKTTNSTTMSFACKVKTLREDLPVWRRYTKKGIPKDFSAFKHLLGIGSIFHRVFGKRRTLISPIPTQATHAEKKYLAPLIDWHKF